LKGRGGKGSIRYLKESVPPMKLSYVVALLAMVAGAAVAQDAGNMNVDAQAAVENLGQSLSAGFWGGVDHVVNVLVDFIGRILMKIADAVMVVLRDLGLGGHSR
jgi:hypothetical protein